MWEGLGRGRFSRNATLSTAINGSIALFYCRDKGGISEQYTYIHYTYMSIKEG